MIRYRSFQNWDPPSLAEIWRSQPPVRGRMQPVTPAMLEELVFARPYFDRHGLIVAVDGVRPVGFVHAGFAASSDLSTLDKSQGTTCMLQVMPHELRGVIAMELLAASEDYLRKNGATRLYAGLKFPLNPFYLGLYGGSELPGILASDEQAAEIVRSGGYSMAARSLLWQRSLAGFRAPVDRQQMAVRRRFRVMGPQAVIPDNWWEACVWCQCEWQRFDLTLRDGGEPIVSATFWEILPLSRSWGVRTMGLVNIDDTPEARSEGLTLFLLGEALRQFQSQGVPFFEAHSAGDDTSLAEVFIQLGMAQYDRGILWSKQT
ncbi:hypothetical protein Psta_3252 [Pirellula staleyi DSM 6068]|uniref:N-acetyltransferase domain-containing protein n=1 Tax=Pirellula staleyi (strain ATCC 27377 / DSM 6068 / ICPB 4128) TaxID=530564 RepID=D2QX76_PIRSD|nr:hypothetical protein [Pirellula staleyi]ADB17916.1 hypothetical protein Psta_3252 [Pirellula staleyi DSM 6068]